MMPRHLVVSGGRRLCALAVVSVALGPSAGAVNSFPPIDADAVPAVMLPGSGYSEPFGGSAFVEGELQLTQELLNAMAAWLSSEFDLPRILNVPSIAFVSKEEMFSLRYRDAPPLGQAASSQVPREENLVAIYRPDFMTIFLPLGWTGRTPAESSVLVHEMVHHLQNEAGSSFECPQAREQMAFEAQERWLRLFGTDLQTDFGIDQFTLFVRTKCMHFD